MPCEESSMINFTVSVIIPVQKGGENFRKCLRSLTEASPPANEIIVVLDGATDDSWRFAEEFGAKVLRTPVPGGPAHARNLGANIAGGDLLFFVDADVAISSDAIGQVVAAFRRQPNLAAVFGSYDDKPEASNFFSQYKNLFHHYIHQTSCEEASTFWGACGAIRRDAFRAVGGFDELYRQPSIEDIELGYRLKRTGKRIQLCKILQAKHLKRWSFISLLNSDIFHRALPWIDLVLRRRWLINDLNLRTSSRISVILVYGLLMALVGIRWWSGSIAFAGIIILSLLVLNISLYQFFNKKCGLKFTLKAIPLHWLYYLYSGFAFIIGITRYLFHRDNSFRTSLFRS